VLVAMAACLTITAPLRTNFGLPYNTVIPLNQKHTVV
jgi:hypothetical protein